jgi:hypothetical protein
MDIDQLLHALDNDKNESIVDLDYAKISKDKNDTLQQLNCPKPQLKRLHQQLKSYRLVEDIKDIHFGSYVRWISLKNPEGEIKLTNGGIVCDMKVINDDVHIKCKNNMNRLFQIKMSETILFQKLSDQEQVILSALKFLNN